MTDRIDPVCGKPTSGVASITHELHGVEYAFCSAQCSENFIAHPHIYVGRLGMKAPKALGVELIKKRSFRLVRKPSAAQAQAIENALGTVLGVKSREIHGGRVHVSYDLLQATAKRIVATIVSAGGQVPQHPLARLYRTWVSFGEENELSNFEVRKHSCCH